MMNINSTAAFLLCQACCPAMAEKGWGRVVNITSWAWKSGGLTAGTAYAASKGAMTSLTFSVALQYAKLRHVPDDHRAAHGRGATRSAREDSGREVLLA